MKKYILFAGVNGAGKSTLYQSQTFPFDFLSTFLSTFDFQSLESPCLQGVSEQYHCSNPVYRSF